MDSCTLLMDPLGVPGFARGRSEFGGRKQ